MYSDSLFTQIMNFFTNCILFMQKTSWKNLFAYMGPGFLVSIAYIDPGNCKINTFRRFLLFSTKVS